MSAATISRRNPVGHTHPCLCGCGDPVREGVFYRSGHDARHASQIGHQIADIILTVSNEKSRDRQVLEALSEMPTTPLTNRAVGIAQTAVAREQYRRQRVTVVAEPGMVKVGSRSYPATLHPDGHVTYRIRGGALRTATPRQAASFEG